MVDRFFKESCGIEETSTISKRFRPISICEAGVSPSSLCSSVYGPRENILLVLKNLKEKVEANEQVNFLIDEVNQEIFTKDYSTELAEGLKVHFEESTVVIALQSVEKSRKVQAIDGESIFQATKMDIGPLKEAGVKLLELKRCTRMSLQLHEMETDLEDTDEKSQFRAPFKLKENRNNSE